MAIGTYIKSVIKEHIMAILIALASFIGLVVGSALLEYKDGLYTSREKMYISFPGEILMQMLWAIAPSLMIGSLVTSVSNLDTYISPRIGGQLFVYILVTKFESVALGIGVALIFRPGDNGKMKDLPFHRTQRITLMDSILDLLRNMFPRSMIEMNFSTYETVLITPSNTSINRTEWEIKEDGNMSDNINQIGIISWSILLGTALSVMEKGNLPLIYFFHCLTKISTIITVWVLWISPVMIVCLLAGDMLDMKEYYEAMEDVESYVKTVHWALLIQFCIVYPSIYFYFVRKNPLMLYKHYWHALVTAFATSSSLASLPISIKSLIEKSEMDPRIVWFVIPVSHCMNMDGIAIFLGVAAVFIAQTDNLHVTSSTVIPIIILGAIASFVSAPVPGSHIMSLVLILDELGISSKQAQLMVIVDWLVNRSVTVVNIMGDAVAVGVIESYNKDWLELEISETELRKGENTNFGSSSKPNTSAAKNVTPREPVTPSETVTPSGSATPSERGASKATVSPKESATPRFSRMKSAMPRRARGTLDSDNLKESDKH